MRKAGYCSAFLLRHLNVTQVVLRVPCKIAIIHRLFDVFIFKSLVFHGPSGEREEEEEEGCNGLVARNLGRKASV